MDYTYPKACCKTDSITIEQILFQIHRLKLYKALGPNSIPNIILIRYTDLLANRLYYIYKAMLEHNMHYAPWKTFTIVVLWKLGKSRYNIPKAYHPIALLNTI